MIIYGIYLGINATNQILTVYEMGNILDIIKQNPEIQIQASVCAQTLSENDLSLINVLLDKYSVFTFEELKLIISYCKLYDLDSIEQITLNHDFHTASAQIMKENWKDVHADRLLFVISIALFILR